MRYLRLLTACLLVPVALAGCATSGSGGSQSSWDWCVIGGAVAGAASGVAVDGGVGGGLIGAASGAVLGQVLCSGDGPMMSDSDGDGVPDDKDKCPDTPKIAHHAIDADGCPLYSDADDVPDYLDRCPQTPAGVKVDSWGCPLDSDGDGVPDHMDKCPGTPAGTKVDDQGCPMSGEKLAIVTNVNFDFDSAKIRSDAAEKLDRVAQILADNPDVNVRIVGHTDSTGPDAYNMKLSERRAVSVRQYLAGKGVSMARMSVMGKGEAEPLVSNNTRAGRAVNRRVEFEVVE